MQTYTCKAHDTLKNLHFESKIIKLRQDIPEIQTFIDFQKYFENCEFCGLVRKTLEALPGGPRWLFDHFEYLKFPSCNCLRHGICLESLSFKSQELWRNLWAWLTKSKIHKSSKFCQFFTFFQSLGIFLQRQHISNSQYMISIISGDKKVIKLGLYWP